MPLWMPARSLSWPSRLRRRFIDSAARSELPTKGDIAELKAEIYRAKLIHTAVAIGAIVTLLKLLP